MSVFNVQWAGSCLSTYLTESTFSSPGALALPTNMCLVFSVQPGIFKNWSNSSTRRLQQDHPLLPSWNTGWPGWWMHFSSSRAVDPVYVAPHPFRRHVALAGISRSGSSESGSGVGAGGVGGGMAGEMAERSGTLVWTGAGSGGGSATLGGSGAGVSSTVECLPVVHGGMARNSSKVKTRGLQHFQPGAISLGISVATTAAIAAMYGRMQTWKKGNG